MQLSHMHIGHLKGIMHMAIFFIAMLKMSILDKKLSLLEKKLTHK